MRYGLGLLLAAALAVSASACDYTTIYEYAPPGDGGVEDGDMRQPNIDGWFGKFGGSVMPTVRPVPTVTAWNSIIGDSVIDIKTIDGLPRPVAVTLVPPLFGDRPSQGAELVAIVSWGAGGHMARAYVDVSRGGTVNLVAASVQVEIVQTMVLGLAFPPAISTTPRCGAFAGPGPVTGATRPTRTVGVDMAVVPGATAGIIIPPFARSVRFIASPSASTIRVRLYATQFPTLANGEFMIVAFPSDEIVLPGALGWNGPDFPSLDVANVGAANVDAFAAIFQLDL